MNTVDISYAHTDLAIEGVGAGSTDISEEMRDGCVISRLSICGKSGEQRYGRPRGQYVTVDCGRMWELDDDSMERVSGVIAHELSRMVRRLCGKPLSRDFGVLVAGLGND